MNYSSFFSEIPNQDKQRYEIHDCINNPKQMDILHRILFYWQQTPSTSKFNMMALINDGPEARARQIIEDFQFNDYGALLIGTSFFRYKDKELEDLIEPSYAVIPPPPQMKPGYTPDPSVGEFRREHQSLSVIYTPVEQFKAIEIYFNEKLSKEFAELCQRKQAYQLDEQIYQID